MYPRSSAKMLQALPLIESGAAEAKGLTSTHLALACASHNGAAIHTEPVTAWLADMGLNDDDFVASDAASEIFRPQGKKGWQSTFNSRVLATGVVDRHVRGASGAQGRGSPDSRPRA